ncbi:MAG TPA: LysM peptidoglycan-binding domain-containing protein, partial [Patescibacteria group bacterium]
MSFEYKSSPVKKKRESEKEESGITRRGFLKAGLAFGTALVGGRVVSDYLEEKKETDISIKEIPKSEKNNPASKDADKAEATPEQEEIYVEDMESAESIADILDFDRKDPIRLTSEKMEKVKNYWKQKYAGADPKLHKSLIDGYREWGYWRPYTESRFSAVGVPVRYALLALPESHWKVNARSKAGAVGPYQFMPETARSFNLKMNRIIDERRDPVKSAEACALVLKELYAASGDWNVALSGYNGGYAWKFIKEAKSKGQATNYGNFLQYLEEKLNKIKDELQKNKKEHQVEKHETISKIARIYKINPKALCQINGITSGKIFVGQGLVIPENISHETKRKIFAQKISGFTENLNYPWKLHGIEEVIKEGKVHEQNKPIKFREEKIVVADNEPASLEHAVAKGETLFGIARKFNIAPQELYKYNKKISNIRSLRVGDKINIPSVKGKNRKQSVHNLVSEAKKGGKTVAEMRFLNPHIIDAQAPLP